MLAPRVAERDLLEVEDVRRYYAVRRSSLRSATLRAVDGVSFRIGRGETFTLVGESGSGKSTTARMVLRLERPSAGRVRYMGRDIHELRGRYLRDYRGSIQAVFQDPYSSLNPRMRAGDIVGEPLVIRGGLSRAERRERVAELLVEVGLSPALVGDYPHEFSGGMRQRLALARALSTSPSLIVLDEPVSALDVSVRAQIMNLLRDLQERHGIAYLLIAHNLATVRFLGQSVAAMYLGQVVEDGPTRLVLSHPRHPYTVALLSASTATRTRQRIVLDGEIPSPVDPPSACRFRTRCWLYRRLGEPARCREEAPPLRHIEAEHRAACHFAEELDTERSPSPAVTRS
jgi:oligopeptide/dipeptide ABC transporter ATP-binding protein